MNEVDNRKLFREAMAHLSAAAVTSLRPMVRMAAAASRQARSVR